MSESDVTELVDALEDAADDALRCVATYDNEGYDPVYVRDGLSPRISRLGDGVHQDLVLQEIGREHLENLFDAGGLHCSMHRFDELTAFHFVASEYRGVFVSIDSDADVPLASFAETCRDHI